ncbi:hypothetical protein [Sphingosinicella terrae]|uniref:hypothetical protein n=1 Tax=Sphingosinicella terrae TaxID=2172047 RepID=UPI000E0D1B5C|nr:hypothetical protein [Sphingosinicella terrae]
MILTLFIAVATAAPLPDCPIDRAVYRLNGAPQFTAGFARQDRRKQLGSDLALWLRTPEHLYWFSLGSPNGYGGTYLAPDIDPRRAARMDDDEERDTAERIEAADMPPLPFDAFRADLSTADGPPQTSDPAPALLFARGLGPALWYDWTRAAAGDPRAVQESMPIGLFEPAGCDGPPPER